MRLMAFLLLTLASTSAVFAQEGPTGNEMLPACRAVATSVTSKFDDQFSAGFCAGMILMSPYTGRICAPDNVSLQQAAKVLVKFFDDYPQLLNFEATVLATRAFAEAWPCPKAN